MIILVTGGAGYIGSHTVLELLKAGYQVVVMDNLKNSKREALHRIESLTGKKVSFHKTDLLNKEELKNLFRMYEFDAVIHFAGLKAVGESVEKPLLYYENNVAGSLNLFQVMDEFSVRSVIFSSSATVYGIPESVPINEDSQLTAVNPYGRSKLVVEYMLKDLHQADNRWNITVLRYFNPVGADESGLIGEDPTGVPDNLMPYITRVAAGKLRELTIFGDDYPTRDGTGVRDFIHVTDLALGHLKALEAMTKKGGIRIYNLGTGKGYSVLDLVKTFEEVTGIGIPFKTGGRRAGDIAECFADPSRAEKALKWRAERGLPEMCRDAWRWQQSYPDGY